MSKNVNEVREEVLRELKIDITNDTIRRDQNLGLYAVPRDRDNNYRVYSASIIEKIKLIALLRDIGLEREDIKLILQMNDIQAIWNKVHQLTNVTIPALKARL